MPQSTRRFIWILYALTAAMLVGCLTILPWWTVDDAFISYRYGRNLLETGELTWNPGEAMPVEGYTGILLPLLAAGILALGLPLIATIKFLGVLSMLATLFLAHRIMERMGVAQLWKGVAILYLAATPLFGMHALSGLETIFFAFLITATFWGLGEVKHSPGNMTRSILLAASLVLAGLCRPEGIALAGIVVVDLLWWLRKQRQLGAHVKAALFPALAVCALLVYWIWRTGYYHSLFPNSYHAKVYEGLLNIDSVDALVKFLGYYCLVPFFMAIALKAMRKPHIKRDPSPLNFHFTYGLFVLLCAAAYLHSNLWMNYGSRFFFPFLPITAVLIFQQIDHHWAAIQENSRPTGNRRLRIALGIFAAVQVAILGFRHSQVHAFLNYYHPIVQEELIPAGKYLAETLPPDAVVISYMDAGAVGWYSRLKVIDFGRLNDRYLAQNKPSTEDAATYFFNQGAKAAVMTSESLEVYHYIPEAKAIVDDPRFDRYHLEKQWGNSADYPYWQFLYLRKP
jgi:hypothetical protein